MPDKPIKTLLVVAISISSLLVSIAAISLALGGILGNPAWSVSALYTGIKDFQSIIGGGLALAGILLGFYGNRRRDERLRRQEARALALALYGELAAALTTCRAYTSQIKAILAKSYDDEWLDQEILGTNFAPRVRTKVYEANVDKLGLLGEPLVGNPALLEHLVVEIVFAFDSLFDFARMADKEERMTRREMLKRQDDFAEYLEGDAVIALRETMDILQAYIYGGLPAATKAAHSIMPNRKTRQDKFGEELGVGSVTAEEGKFRN